MKFLLATGIYPPEIGGPATAIQALAEVLRARGHEVTVVTYGDGPRDSGVVAVPRRGHAVARYWRFACAIRLRLAPDTVVLATDVFSVGIPVRLALIGKRNRFVLRLGGEWFWEDSVERQRDHRTLRAFWQAPPRGLRGGLVRLDYRWILSRAQKIMVTSALLKGILSAAFPAFASRLAVANNQRPVDLQPTAHEPHAPLRLLYVGRFARVKNVPFLARVVRALHAEGVSVAVTFVGDGATLEETKTILRDLPRVSFLGARLHPEVLRLMAEQDALLLPSLSDIYPNAVVEALASGLPVVMTDQHGLPRGFAGTIELPPTDEQAWVAAIRRLAEPSAYLALASSAVAPEVSGPSLIDLIV